MREEWRNLKEVNALAQNNFIPLMYLEHVGGARSDTQ
jgi:hypothetical protein